jgi:flagellar hook-length control protein FliK
VTADTVKTAAQKPVAVPASPGSPAAPTADPNAASAAGATVNAATMDAVPTKLADLPALDVRGLGGRAADKSGVDKSGASKPAPDGSDTAGLLAMVALAVPVSMTSVAPAVPVAAGATDETAANGGSARVSPVIGAADAAVPAAGVAAPAEQAPPSATVPVPVGAPVVGASVSGASTSAAIGTASTSAAIGTASTSAAIGTASTSAAIGSSIDSPSNRVKARTTTLDAAQISATGDGTASTSSAPLVPGGVVPIAPVQQGDAHTKDESANEPPLAAVASAASVPAAPVTPAGAAAGPASVAQAVPTQAFTDQIARPILTLREADVGTHVLTIQVAPDSLGPVTVRAHLDGDGIRIELMAPTVQGRSALYAILPDLKRDLAQGGMNSSVNVSSQDATAGQGANSQQGSQFGARQDAWAAGNSGGQGARQDAWSPRGGNQPAPHDPVRPATVGGTSLLDVYA